MIVESAFFKLPELLLGHDSPAGQYEATLANHLAMAVLLELNARNIPMPQRRIHVERPYPLKGPGPAMRSDLYIDLEGVFAPETGLCYYGAYAHNWIECKIYAEIGRMQGSVPKVGHIGSLAKDLLRLCLFVQEGAPGTPVNGRYMLAVFNRPPQDYLAFSRRAADPRRTWLLTLLSPGHHRFDISLQGEPKSMLEMIGRGFLDLDPALQWSLEVETRAFEPALSGDPPDTILYWGYLVRIVGFSLCMGIQQLNCRDDLPWSEEQLACQRQLAKSMLELMAR